MDAVKGMQLVHVQVARASQTTQFGDLGGY